MCKVVERVREVKELREEVKKGGVVVKVRSLGYKKGMGEDCWGKGGGLVLEWGGVKKGGK